MRILKALIWLSLSASPLEAAIRPAALPVSGMRDSSIFSRTYRRIYRYLNTTNRPKEEKRFDFSIIGGPHYSSDTELGLGIVASGLYRVDRENLGLQPSNLSLYGDLTTTGFFLLGIRGTTLFQGDRNRLDIDLHFFSLPSKYWGMGYAAGSRRDRYTRFKRLEQQCRAGYAHRILPSTYLGALVLFNRTDARDIGDPSFWEGAKTSRTSLGFGLSLSYDTRDFIPNPYRGTYARLEQTFFPGFWGGRSNRTELVLRHYTPLWKGCILASDLQGTFNCGDTPWTMTAQLGGAYAMRGYYEGEFHDRQLLQTQVELRQHIYNRHGTVLWAGAGNVFPSLGKARWKETLPTFGIGYRWEFKKRVNVRLDYGIGRGQSAFYFNIEEAF